MRLLVLAGLFAASSLTFAAESAKERLRDATEVFNDIMATPDKGIPQDLLDRAQCAIIVPGLKKGAFIVGGEYGKGFAVCRRQNDRGWGAPAAIKVEGGSFGFQIGGEGTDVVMLVMSDRGMDHLTKDKFTLGADASVAAGPVGRHAAAQTDAAMSAEILSWSRSKGLFAGIALKGASIRPDLDANRDLYGTKLATGEIVRGTVAPPADASPLIAALDRYSAHKGSAAREQK